MTEKADLQKMSIHLLLEDWKPI